MGINLLFFKSSTTVGIKHKNSISISYLARKIVNLIFLRNILTKDFYLLIPGSNSSSVSFLYY